MAILGQAKVGKMRLGAHRLNFYEPKCYITVGGSRCETQMRWASVSIHKRANSASAVQGTTNRLTGTMNHGAVTPVEGQDVKVYCGSTAPQSLLFGGTIQNLSQNYDGERPANVYFELTAVGYAWLMNRKIVLAKSYRRVSATVIILDLISTYASDVTTVHVERAMPAITISFTKAYLADALNQIAQLVGSGTVAARWWLDDSKDLWFFTADPRLPPETVAGKSTTNPLSNVYRLIKETDLAQVRTRVLATGSGSARVLAPLPAGGTVVPIDNAYPYGLPSGMTSGQAQLQPPAGLSPATAINITYTGTKRSSVITPPDLTTTSVSFFNSGSGHLVAGTTYTWVFTYATSSGETTASASITGTCPGGSNAAQFAMGRIFTTANGVFLPPDAAITAINIYRLQAGGYYFSSAVVGGNSGTWVTPPTGPANAFDYNADSTLTAQCPPLTNTAVQGTSSTTTTSGASAGATTITTVDNVGAFDASGGFGMAGGVLFQYSSVSYPSANTPSGTLNLASALALTIGAGATLTAVPALTGVPSAGTGSLTTVIPANTQVVPYFMAEDAAAQAVMAALTGGDGIHEHPISDTAWLTIDMVASAAQASLALDKTAEKRIELDSRDYKIQPGSAVPVNVGAPTNIAGSFAIDDITLSQIQLKIGTAPYVYPLITARGSTTRKTLDDFLWHLRLAADQKL